MFEEEEPEYRYVLGMDPGGTTGIAMLRYTDETQPELIYLHQIEDGREGFYQFFNGSELGEDLDVASEVWEERNLKGADRTPRDIENVQFVLWHDEMDERLHYQSPSVKSLVPDEWLKEQNLWTPGKRHQMDALIHALVWLRNNDHRPTQEALSGQSDETIAEQGEAESKQLSESGEQVEAVTEAMKQLANAAQQAADEFAEMMAALAEQAEDGVDSGEGGEGGEPMPGEGEGQPQPGQGQGQGVPAGSGGNGGHGDWDDSEPVGERKRKSRNGVFAGFEPEDGEGKELFSD